MKKIICLVLIILISQIAVFADNNAIDEYTRIINSNPQNKNILVSNYCLRGITYKANNNYDAAINDFLNALKYTSDENKNINKIIYQELAETQLYTKDYESAIDNMSKAIAIEPNNSYYYYLRAKMYLAQSNYKKVLEDTTNSIKLKNKNPNAFYLRGLAEYKIGDIEKSKQDINFAKQQYYDLGMFDKYQEVVTLLNNINSVNNRDYSTYPQNYDDGIRIILP